MKRVVSLLVMCLCASPIFADPIHGLGFAAGQLSGIGLSYRVMTDSYGAQITFGAISIKEDYSEYDYPPYGKPEYTWPVSPSYIESRQIRETDGNIGLMFMKTLHNSKWARLYALTGFCMFLQMDFLEEQEYRYQQVGETYYEYVPYGDPEKKTEKESTFYGGLGIGIEIKFSANIRLALEWPLSFSSDGDFVMYIPQAGLHYFF